MTKQNIIKKMDKTGEKINELQVEYSRLNAELIKGGCDHSRTREYQWTHSNGYGTHTDMTGTVCVFCGFEDPYNRGRFLKPSRYDWDRD